jgi:hypothetical protein
MYPAHRQAGEREAFRRPVEKPPGDRRHGVVAGVVGDQDLAPGAKRGDLRLEKPRRAVQPRHEHQRVSHVPRPPRARLH